jgi:hypothetical protein
MTRRVAIEVGSWRCGLSRSAARPKVREHRRGRPPKPNTPDSMAEKGGFEPSRPFNSRCFPSFHAHFLSPGRNSRGPNGAEILSGSLCIVARGDEASGRRACAAFNQLAESHRPSAFAPTEYRSTGAEKAAKP